VQAVLVHRLLSVWPEDGISVHGERDHVAEDPPIGVKDGIGTTCPTDSVDLHHGRRQEADQRRRGEGAGDDAQVGRVVVEGNDPARGAVVGPESTTKSGSVLAIVAARTAPSALVQPPAAQLNTVASPTSDSSCTMRGLVNRPSMLSPKSTIFVTGRPP
jgi:hypothetical protein